MTLGMTLEVKVVETIVTKHTVTLPAEIEKEFKETGVLNREAVEDFLQQKYDDGMLPTGNSADTTYGVKYEF